MRTRCVVVAGAVLLALAVGLVFATPGTGSNRSGRWDGMHDSSRMRQMHLEMPAHLQAQGDTIHAQMDDRIGDGARWAAPRWAGA